MPHRSGRIFVNYIHCGHDFNGEINRDVTWTAPGLTTRGVPILMPSLNEVLAVKLAIPAV